MNDHSLRCSATRSKLREVRKVVESATKNPDSFVALNHFHYVVAPTVVLALLDYIDELEERAGEKDSEDE